MLILWAPVLSAQNQREYWVDVLDQIARPVISNLAAGTYTLRMQNIMEWGQPKLLNISLQYDGVLPSGVQNITTHATDNRAYGRT